MEACVLYPKEFLQICEKNEERFTHKSNFNEVKGKALENLKN